MASTKKIIDGQIVTTGIHGRIRVAATHSTYEYEIIYCCEPAGNTICNTCGYRFTCFTDEEIQVVFRGETLGAFPSYWHETIPTESELEQYLFGTQTHSIKLREIPSYKNRVINLDL